MEQAFAESDTGLSYKDDVEPWLGDEAAFFVSSVDAGGEEAHAAFLVATEDEDATVDAVEKEGDVRKTEHRGRDVYVSQEGEGAAAVVDGWLVLGNVGGVKAAIDTAEDGEPIEDDDRYNETLEDAPEDRLGFMYMNGPAFYEALRNSPAAAMLPEQFRRFFNEPLLATVNADDRGIRFEGTVPASLLSGFPIVGEGSGADELPADSWLAMSQPDLGQTIETYVDFFAGVAGGRDVIEQQLRAETGLDLDRDVISWMGEWGAFARGTSVDEVEGALIIETSDEAASGRFIAALARVVREQADPGLSVGPLELGGGGEGVTLRGPEIPKPIHLFQRDGRVVAAYGDAAARDALDPSETLADSASFSDAQEALGGDYPVSLYVAIGPLLELADSAGAAADEDLQKAKPYLEPLGALVGGVRKEGDKLHSAFGLTVK